MEYIVRWDIQLDADSPKEAAEKALAWIKGDSICHVFTTRDEDDICHTVDLNEDEENQVLPLSIDQFHEITANPKP